MSWKKAAPDAKTKCERWTSVVPEGAPPEERFTLKALAKPDGRWVWEVYAAGADRPMATGVVASLGRAKNVSEQFLKRSGPT